MDNLEKTTPKEQPENDERHFVEDFNLLDVPRGLDLYSLLRDFVIPRMPDGFIVKMGSVVVEPRRSLDREFIEYLLFTCLLTFK